MKLKDQHKNTVIGFNNSGKPLGQRDDLHLLIAIGKANYPPYLEMFEDVPDDDELLKIKEDRFKKSQEDKANNRKTRK